MPSDKTLNNFSRKSLSGAGTNEGQTTRIVAEVKHVKEAPHSNDRRIEISSGDQRARSAKMYVDAERRIAESLKLGRTYEMTVADGPNRGGGGTSTFNIMKEVRRLKGKPVEVKDMGSTGGSRGVSNRFGKGFSGSHMDFI